MGWLRGVRVGTLVIVVIVGSGIAASAALGQSFSLRLTGPTTATVGKPFVLTASGTDPTDEGALYLEIYAIPASVTTTCPTGYLDAGQLAGASGGSDVALDQREDLDASGNFTNTNAYTPAAPGGVLFCAYTDDGATDTLAATSLITNATAGGGAGSAPPPAPHKPVSTARPTVKQSGKTLRCSRGRWTGASSYAYSWLVNGRLKHGARGQKLTVTGALKRHLVVCRVTASNAAGRTTASSRALRVH